LVLTFGVFQRRVTGHHIPATGRDLRVITGTATLERDAC